MFRFNVAFGDRGCPYLRGSAGGLTVSWSPDKWESWRVLNATDGDDDDDCDDDDNKLGGGDVLQTARRVLAIVKAACKQSPHAFTAMMQCYQ